jgi:hypothetical protein
VAIDGSKFKAVNSRDKNFTSAKMRPRMEQIEQSITRYLDNSGSLMTVPKREPPSITQGRSPDVSQA